MDYSKHYAALIGRAKLRSVECYTETHHIIPKCMGGTDDKDNLVELTPEEHYVAHQLLSKIYPNNPKLIRAAAMMVPNRPSNKLYGWVRRRFSEAQSLLQTGSSNSQYNTVWITDGKANKKISCSDIIPEGWYKGRYIKSKEKEPSPREIKRSNDIATYKKYYEIYSSVGFVKFVELTGYNKSKANLVQRFSVLLGDDFKPQNGKKRG